MAKKKQTSWGDALNTMQQQAERTGQTYTITVQPKGAPAQPAYVATDTWGRGSIGRSRRTNNSVQIGDYGPQPAPPGYLTQGQQGPMTRAQAQGSYRQPQQAPAQSAPRQQGRTRSFTQAQPVLAQAAADKIRSQYAGIQGSPGGAFVTDTNQGLLDLLTRAGITPTPLEQWGQLLSQLQRR